MQLADRMKRLGTESAFEVLAKARALEAQGRKIIHLEIGEPDFDTPPHIGEAAAQAIRDGYTHYTPAPGIPELREAVAAWFSRTRGVDYPPDRIVAVPGAKPVLFYTIMALCQQGDEVIYPDPSYPMYQSISAFAGAKPVPVPLREENEFRLDPDELAGLLTDRTRIVFLNTPENPCGSALTHEDHTRIAEVLSGRDVYVVTDEVYWAIRYDGEHSSISQIDGMQDRTILLDGCSKAFAMTGWRMGFAALPPLLVEPVNRLIINSVSCTATFVQKAAVAALEGPFEPVREMVEEFRRRRAVIVAGLNQVPGFRCLEPRGAFYAFPNIAGTGRSSEEVADYLLDRAGVAILPGTAFGPGGQGYLRFSYASSVQNIRDALEAIEAVLPELVGD
ncbi:MAG: pyridoxal phosphate-dependent aminotransferase [Actinomycetota bacterium]